MCPAQPAAGAGAAGGGPLDFLRTNPQFIALRQIVQSNPMILQPMLQVCSCPALHALSSLTACPVKERPRLEVAAACSSS